MALLGLFNPSSPGLMDYWEDDKEYTDSLDLINAFIEERRERWLPISVEPQGSGFAITVLDFKSRKWRHLTAVERKARL